MSFVVALIIGAAIGIASAVFSKSNGTSGNHNVTGEDEISSGDSRFGNHRDSGKCNGDCDNCPDHYGYRYGRWYYGHGHQHGCERGGNGGATGQTYRD